MQRRQFVLAVATVALLPPAALASNTRGPNGGHRTDIGGGHGELVAEGNELRLYLSDNSYRPRSAEGASARAVVLAGGRQTTVMLVPAGPDLLRGQGDFTAGPGMRVVVTLSLPGQQPSQGRFTPRDGV